MSPKELSAKLEAASAHLQSVERKRMPGGYALFTAGKIFANVTVDGRLGVKLTATWAFQELAAMPGAGPWTLGKKNMEHWVLLPPALLGSDDAVKLWVERAYGCAIGKPPLPPARHELPEPPPTMRANDTNGSLYAKARTGAPAVVEVSSKSPPPPELPSTPPVRARRRSLVPAPPSSTNGVDLSSYAPAPPSSVGIRLVPRDSKSPYEETLVGVPAPPSSRVDVEDE